MQKSLFVITLLCLTACATPVTTLANKQGNVVTCGGGTAGSIAGGLVGYTIQEGHDKNCVDQYKAQGYSIQ